MQIKQTLIDILIVSNASEDWGIKCFKETQFYDFRVYSIMYTAEA